MNKVYFMLPYGVWLKPPDNDFRLKVANAPTGWAFFHAGVSLFLIEGDFDIAWYRIERAREG